MSLRHVLLLYTFFFVISCAEIDGICSYSCTDPPVNTTGLEITLSNSNFFNQTIVGAEGNFTFYDVPSGTYTLSVPENPLYYKYTQSITVTSTSQIIQVNFVIETQMEVYPPPNLIVNCENAPFTATNATGGTGLPGVSSYCKSIGITYSDTDIESTCSYTIQRTFYVASSGDVNSPQQVIQTLPVQDESVPVFSFFPSDVTEECPGSPVTTYPVASSECNTPITLTFSDSVTGNVCRKTINRTWTASDCFAAATQTQTIVVVDTTSPSFTSFPSDMTFQCSTTESGAPVNTGYPVAADKCSASVVISVSTSKQGTSPNCQILTHTFTATDQCGLSTTRTQKVTFNDVTPPIFTFFVDEYVGSCSNITTSPSITGWSFPLSLIYCYY